MPNPSDLSIVMVFLRIGENWSQTQLAEAGGLPPSLINDYESGRKKLARRRLEYLASLMGIPGERIDESLACLAANRAAALPPSASGDFYLRTRREIETIASQVGRLATGFARSALTLLTFEGEAFSRRELAERQFSRLQRSTLAERLLLVEEAQDYRNWALCERIARESVALAPNHPKKALEWARLAVRISELVPGDKTWRSRVQGWALLFLSNALRACSDLQAAKTALARGRKLWEAGATGDPGLLNEAWLPWIEAALDKDLRKFAEAVKSIDEALRIEGQGELRGQILLSKSSILQILGESEASTAVLLEAEPLIDAGREPRLAFGLRFNLLVDLCELGRAEEGEPRLPEVQALAERLGEKMDIYRVVWLRGKIGSACGRLAEALADLEQVQREFHSLGLALDFALVSLDLSLVLLRLGRPAEVRPIAEEMFTIFKAQEIHREALAAVRIFCTAAKQEATTIELTRRVARFLRRSQLDPELRFEEEGAEAL